MTKRILSLALALLMLVSLAGLVSCSEEGGDADTTAAEALSTAPEATTGPRVDEEGYLLDDVPELNFGGKTIRLLAWDGQSYEEFNPTEDNGDIVEQAIMDRNAIVEERIGVKLEVIKTKGGSGDYEAYTTLVSGDVMAGSANEFDLLAAYSRTIAMCAYRGLTSDLRSTKFFDVEKPWWPETLINQSTIGGKLFFCSGDLSISLFHNLDVVYFNKNLAENFKIGANTIYDTALSGKWTLDKMIEWSQGVYADLDSDGKKSDADRYGFLAANTQSQPIVWGCGIVAVDTDKDGKMTVSDSFVGEKMQNIQEKLFAFLNEDTNGLAASSTGVGNTAFAENRALFFCNIATYTMSKFNIDGLDFGLLPPPKYNADQEKYYSVEGNAFTLYAIENNVSVDTDMCSAYLELLSSIGYRKVSPAMFELSMKMRYSSDQSTSMMYDIIKASVLFDNGRIFSGVVNDIFTKTYNDQFKAADSAWVAKIASVRTEMDAKIADLNQVFESLK